MAGEISQRIAAEIRDILSQVPAGTGKQLGQRGLLKNDFLIYNALDKYQRQFLLNYYTNIGYYTLELVTGTASYPLHPRVFQIFSVEAGENNVVSEYNGRYDAETHSLVILNDDVISQDTLKIGAYLKPAKWTQTNGQGSNGYEFDAPPSPLPQEPVITVIDDRISDTTDPIIPEDYHSLLTEAVLSEYRHIFPQFRPIELIKNDVRVMADTLRPAAVMRARNLISPYGSLRA